MFLFKKKAKLTCIVTLLLLVFTSQTAYAVGPTEHSFGVNHPYLEYTNEFKGATYYINALDSTGTSSYIHTEIDKWGYYNAYDFSNNKASTIRDAIGSDAIFYFNGHGAAGKLIAPWYNPITYSWEVNWVTANTTSDSKAFSLQYKYANTTDKLKSVRVAYFSSCYSAVSDPDYGNLTTQAYNLGVDASFGFMGEVDSTKSAYFDKRAIVYYGSNSNNTIAESAYSAAQDTFAYYQSYGGVNSWAVVGDSNETFVPVGYGNY